MTNRLSSAFAKHLKQATKPRANPVRGQQQEAEALKVAMTLHLQGRLREAEKLCLEILSRNPRNARASYVAGRVASDAGDESLAEQRFKQALRESPHEPLFLIALAKVSRHDYEAAIKLYLKALSIRPDMIEALCGLAHAYVKTGRANEALKLWEKVLRLEPGHSTARLGLADALTGLNRVDEASAVLRESIALGRSIGASYGKLATTQTFSSEPAELNAILAELANEKIVSAEATHLHYAAGKILNDLKRYDEAIQQYVKANLSSGQYFDIGPYRQAVTATIQAFGPTFLSSRAGFGEQTDVPVFVVGMPRSGTTLTEQICSRVRTHKSVSLSDLM